MVPATHLDDMARDGAGFAGFAAGDLNQGPHDPDIINMPDFQSLTILPWRKDVAWVPGNLHVSGKPWPYCPRTILTRQLERGILLYTSWSPKGRGGNPGGNPWSRK